MTDIGYDNIISRMRDKTIDVPTDMDLRELRTWILGYSKCQNDDLDIVLSLKEGNDRNAKKTY